MREFRSVETVAAVRALVEGWRGEGASVALVPTMGNLHAGHVSLAELASASAERVLMTIFVNPTQFVAGEDFASYPRTPVDDLTAVDAAGTVDALFTPSDTGIYPFGTIDAIRLAMPALSRELCGAYRPGHFDGVAGVVARLLNIVQPDVLVMGQKDYQQLKIVERLVADLHFPVRVLGGPIMRESDGLAMSSRNRYLTAEQRRVAPQLHAALESVAVSLRTRSGDFAQLADAARASLESVGFSVDYVEIRDADNLGRPTDPQSPGELIVLAAAWLGSARLIDNVRV